MIIITDALHTQQHNDATHVMLDPSLLLTPSAYRVEWFNMASSSPFAWYAWLHGCSPTRYLLSHLTLQEDDRQCWLVSPYHAQLQRDRFYLLPEAELDWQHADALAVCQCLNPILAEEGLRLQVIQGFLLLFSTKVIDAVSSSLTQLENHCLPNRPPQGKDGLELMRIMGDIQTQFYQTPLQRASKNAPVIHGLWLHDPVVLPSLPKTTLTTIEPPHQMDSDNAKTYAISIKTSTQCEALKLCPKRIVLAGDGIAAMLSKRPVWQSWLMPKAIPWLLHQPNNEKILYQRLQQYA